MVKFNRKESRLIIGDFLFDLWRWNGRIISVSIFLGAKLTTTIYQNIMHYNNTCGSHIVYDHITYDCYHIVECHAKYYLVETVYK